MKQGARLGQHFLTNSHYAEVLAAAAGITPDDTVLEIGPGEGMLTRVLLHKAKKVMAVEKDELLAQKLPDIFPESVMIGKLRIVTGDARDVSPEDLGLEAGKYIVAANIPYYITGELIRKFLETRKQPRTLAFLIQKEVAQRIIDTKESILSISVKAYGTPKIAAKVTKGNFNPPPKVDSAILVIDNISKINFANVSEEKFFEVVRAGFASKRKKLANNLAATFGKENAEKALSQVGITSNTRAENVPLHSWLKLAAELVH